MKTTKKRTSLIVSLFASVVLLVLSPAMYAGSLEPSGPPAPTMKTLDEVEPRIPISSVPYTISESGSYYFTGDLKQTTPIQSAISIRVDTNDVTIDLMGYSLIGPGQYGIYMDGRSNVEIRNGTVREFASHGIYEKATGVAPRTKGHRVIGVRVVSNGESGIALEGSGHLVKDCTAVENELYGIYASSGTTVTGNISCQNGVGICVAYSCMVTGNTVSNSQRSGIYAIGGCTVSGNTVRDNNQVDSANAAGIAVCYRCLVKGNTTTDNNQNNIYLTYALPQSPPSWNKVEENHVFGSLYGIRVALLGYRNIIVKNTSCSNATNYDIPEGNAYGPILNVEGVGDISDIDGADHPWANFEF